MSNLPAFNKNFLSVTIRLFGRKMRFIAVVLFLVIVTAAGQVNYKNYKVFQAITKSSDDNQFLEELIKSEDAYTFWDSKKATIMVKPAKVDDFIQTMNSEGIELQLIHEDVQTLIDQQIKRSNGDSEFSFAQYHTLDEIYDWLETLPKKYPGIVKTIVGGRSYEGRNIKGIHISFRKNSPGIFIESGIHAAEWIGPATAIYVINELLTNKDPRVRKLAESYDWYILPSVNPDGFVYSHTKERKWRKNRAKVGNNCYGVDLNRNWGYMWNKIGTSNDSCSDIYSGRKAFSEIEVRTMSQYVDSIADKLFAYLAFHSYAELLIIPYSYSTEKLDNYNETYAIGKVAINALSQKYGTKYGIGTPIEVIHPAAGSSMDWVKHTYKLPLVYAYEFRDKGYYGLLLPPDQIIPNGQEVLDSLVAMFEEARKYGYPKP